MADNPDDPNAWPDRRISDPKTLRAMAHPLRMRLLELLAVHGPATATELGGRVGESPANCSWHLRQLAAAGFIEEAEGGTGRQRIWELAKTGHSYATSPEDDPELRAAGDAAAAIQLEQEVAHLRAWRARQGAESAEWRSGPFSGQSIVWLTSEELQALGEEVKQLFTRHVSRHFEPETRPENARPIRLFAWGVPGLSLEDPPNRDVSASTDIPDEQPEELPGDPSCSKS